MNNKRMIFVFFAVFMLGGCTNGEGTSVNIDKNGVNVQTPGVSVQTGSNKVRTDVSENDESNGNNTKDLNGLKLQGSGGSVQVNDDSMSVQGDGGSLILQ